MLKELKKFKKLLIRKMILKPLEEDCFLSKKDQIWHSYKLKLNLNNCNDEKFINILNLLIYVTSIKYNKIDSYLLSC